MTEKVRAEKEKKNQKNDCKAVLITLSPLNILCHPPTLHFLAFGKFITSEEILLHVIFPVTGSPASRMLMLSSSTFSVSLCYKCQ